MGKERAPLGRAGPSTSWVEDELRESALGDARLDARLRTLVGRLAASPGATIPMACQDWAATKAAYRLLDNPRADESRILEGHFVATGRRAAKEDGPILVLHDTTEFTYKRADVAAVGKTRVGVAGVDRDGRPRLYTACGVLMHSGLAVTTDGLPLGLLAAKFWSRKDFKGTKSLRNKINPTRVPIEEKESMRWIDNLRRATARLPAADRAVHIGDRESDIYELFATAAEVGTHFVVRTCVDRLAGDGGHTVADDMAESRCRGLHRVVVRDAHGNESVAKLEVRFRRLRVLPPIGKQKRYPSLVLTVIHAVERTPPPGRDPVVWKLLTDLSVGTRAEAVEKLDWYALRWRIETFHKVLKSGFRAEDLRLRSGERLVRMLAMLCVVAWRVFWMAMLRRRVPDAPAALAFTPREIAVLQASVRGGGPPQGASKARVGAMVVRLACLGGYLNRGRDSPPGNTVLWRGLRRLSDIAYGHSIARDNVGN